MKTALARLGLWLLEVSGHGKNRRDVLQVHLISHDGMLFQVAQRIFGDQDSAGEKLAWISEMTGKSQITLPLVGLHRKGEPGFINLSGPAEFDPVFLTAVTGR